MATETPQASQVWHHALKLRKHILKQVENVAKNGPSDAYVAQFEAIEGALEKFRLACMQTIFMDFEFAAAQNAEEALWTAHTNINSEYRRCAGRLKQASHAVERRKLDKLYNNFLRVSQKFYKGYIQRISARYDIPELKRVALGMEMEQLEASDAVSPVPSELQAKVLRSCHATLIRLGDLARYRTQAKQKNSSYDSALVCYNLAHHLMPSSGFAFHQMGIVNLDQANHLDVVYHFYRAWAIKSPHPNAKQNLEMEFKSILSPDSSKTKNTTPSVQDAFSMWFLRLHARFYKGEQFPQHKELENEVIHRLELAAKNPSSRDDVLKMMLVNISAHHVASSRYTADVSSQTAAMFYQFILRFNIRFFWTICTVIAKDLETSFGVLSETTDTSQDAKMGDVAEALLPTLRLYCVWFCSNRADIIEPEVAATSQLFKSLATIFSLLCTETYNRTDLASSPYLLAEDVEIRGLEPLCEDKVPQPCRCFCLDDGTLKPNLYNPEQRMGGDGEKMARILDILRCAYFLSEDAGVPLAHQVTNGLLVFEYKAQIAAGVTAGVRDATSTTVSPQSAGAPLENARTTECPQQHNPPRVQNEVGHPENTVMNMLTPFLKPPTPNQLAENSEQEESSYGMHTSTANEVFASLPADPSPARSISSAKFQQLPWDWFNAPRPENATATANSGSRAESLSHVSPGVSPNAGANNVGGARRPDDPFYSPAYQQARSASMAMSRTFSAGGNAANADDQRRAQFLESFQGDHNRVSPFREWTSRMGASEQLMQASWSPGVAPAAMPNSSSVSDFSNLSSIYGGTPANALGIESGASRGMANGFGHDRNPSYGDRINAQQKSLRMDDKRSNYDEAILRSAYHGNK